MKQDRIQIKHDTEENWKKAINFIPLAGEIIIYDGILNEDNVYVKMPRFKIGDGKTRVTDLPFFNQDREVQEKTLIL